MREVKTLTCIGCPMSCPLQLLIVDGEICEVTGFNCKRGEAYARQEFSNPCRMVCTTVTCISGLWPRLPVKTVAAIPKDKVMAVVRSLHTLKVKAPVQMGQVIVENIVETGVAVIATRSMPSIQETVNSGSL